MERSADVPTSSNQLTGLLHHPDKVIVNVSDLKKKFQQDIQDLCNLGSLPPLKKPQKYQIYLWQSGTFGHASVVIGCKGDKYGFLTIELFVYESNNYKAFYPSATFYKFEQSAKYIEKKKWNFQGNVSLSLYDFQTIALDLVDKFEYYAVTERNCQDFATWFISSALGTQSTCLGRLCCCINTSDTKRMYILCLWLGLILIIIFFIVSIVTHGHGINMVLVAIIFLLWACFVMLPKSIVILRNGFREKCDLCWIIGNILLIVAVIYIIILVA